MPDGRLGRAAREDTGRRRFVCIWLLMSARLLDAIMIRDRSAESRSVSKVEASLSGTMAYDTLLPPLFHAPMLQ